MAKNNWQAKKLYEVCDIINGSTPLRSNKTFWDNGDVSWFTIDDIREQGRVITSTKQKITKLALGKISSRLLPPESVLLCCTASVGEYAITTIPLTTNQQFNGLVVKNKKILNPKYLFYFSSTLKDQLFKLSGKTTIDFIPISRLKDIEISLPSISEQQRIVKILDETFESIAKAKSIAEKNLQNSKNLLEVYLDLVFSNPAKGWTEKSLKEVCKYDKSPNKTTNLPYVGLEDIQSNTGKLVGPIDPRSVKSLTFHFTKEHVLYGRLRPYLNKVLLPDFEGHCSTEIFPIKSEENVLNREFLFHWLISTKTMNKINATWTGATLPRANMNTVLDFKINIPPISEQKIISEKINKLSIESKKLELIYQQKLADLEELKKSILSKAFNGDL